MTGLCLAVAAVVRVSFPLDTFTLAWTHSVEKVRWEEDYRVTEDGLRLVEARIEGSGAGMEPPAGAILRDGVYHYQPAVATVPRLRVTVSPYTKDYELCWSGRCHPLSPLVGLQGSTGVVELYGCHVEAPAASPAARR